MCLSIFFILQQTHYVCVLKILPVLSTLPALAIFTVNWVVECKSSQSLDRVLLINTRWDPFISCLLLCLLFQKCAVHGCTPKRKVEQQPTTSRSNPWESQWSARTRWKKLVDLLGHSRGQRESLLPGEKLLKMLRPFLRDQSILQWFCGRLLNK